MLNGLHANKGLIGRGGGMKRRFNLGQFSSHFQRGTNSFWSYLTVQFELLCYAVIDE